MNNFTEIRERVERIAEKHKAKLELAQHTAELKREADIENEVKLRVAKLEEAYKSEMNRAMNEIKKLQTRLMEMTKQSSESSEN